MELERIKYFYKNWKLGFHLIFRTKRFGVNNKWWCEYNSIFGWSNTKKFWGIIKIKPIINNCRMMKLRSRSCHFLDNKEYKLAYNEEK